MQSQNVIKPNKSSSPPDINIYRLPQPKVIQSPLFHKQAAQPINLTYQQVKSLYKKSSINQPHFLPSNKPNLLHQQISTNSHNNQLQSLKKQNHQLKQSLTEVTKLYQQQKFKYNELKNLYKEGQAMFELIQDKKITLEKQNKQLKSLLENFYQQLHNENAHFQIDEKKNQQAQKHINLKNIENNNKIQKVKIGNKKIPVIKVNVPPQTFTKKQHSSSIFSQNSDLNFIDNSTKQQIYVLKQEIQQLKNVNSDLQSKLNGLVTELQANKNLIEQYKAKQQKNSFSSTFNYKDQQSEFMKKSINTQQQNSQNLTSAFDFKFTKLQTQPFSQSFNNHGQMSQYHQDRENISYYKSKYTILQTEVKKKDQALKSLYNQCYALQAEINRVKTQSIVAQPILPDSSRNTRQTWTEQKNFDQINVLIQSKHLINHNKKQSFDDKGEWQYQSKINQLQKRVNELNQMCISNVNQTFRINELNDNISKLTRENSQYEQKIINQDAQLSRLYKILQNKNTQLSEIYTSITESKRNYGMDESKKKSINNIFINTPQKNLQFSSQNLFYSKGYSKDQSFH